MKWDLRMLILVVEYGQILEPSRGSTLYLWQGLGR